MSSVRETYGLQCPKCKIDTALHVDAHATTTVRLLPDGVEDDGDGFGGWEWDENDSCHCSECSWQGTVKDATIDNQPEAASTKEKP